MDVLIADSDKEFVNTLTESLVTAGHRVVLESSLSSVVEIAGSKPFDCIVIDMSLISGCGLGVLTKLKKLQPNCRIWAMTLKPASSEAVATIRASADRYIQKPFWPEDFLDWLAKT